MNRFKTLTQAKRDQARMRAARSIQKRIGPVPVRDTFNNYVASKYPLWFSVLVGIMLAAAALAAGIISGVRLYVAGFNYALDIVPFLGGRIVIGVCTVLAAELLVIVATVAGQVYLHGKQQFIAAVPVVVGTAVALVGNWTITDPASMWGWVETAYPPVAVLSVAFFFELSLVPELERRQADTNAFELARDEWQALTDNVEDHPDWKRAWATALRDELLRHNSMTVEDLTPDEWRAAVEDEMNAEQWYSGGIHMNAVNTANSGRPKIAIAMDFLRDNPDVCSGLVHKTLQQSDAAALAQVSQSTMSRAVSRVRANGHSEEVL